MRSLNFVDTMLTIGTGAGAIYFFDRRVNKYLEMNCSHPCSLNVGPGWLVCISAVFSSSLSLFHCFDARAHWACDDEEKSTVYLLLCHTAAHHTNTLTIIKHMYMNTTTLKGSSKEGNTMQQVKPTLNLLLHCLKR